MVDHLGRKRADCGAHGRWGNGRARPLCQPLRCEPSPLSSAECSRLWHSPTHTSHSPLLLCRSSEEMCPPSSPQSSFSVAGTHINDTEWVFFTFLLLEDTLDVCVWSAHLLKSLAHSVAGDHVATYVLESQLHDRTHISLPHQLPRSTGGETTREKQQLVSEPTFGSCTNAPPLVLGGWSPVVTYFRHSIMVCRERERETTLHTCPCSHVHYDGCSIDMCVQGR